MIRYARDWSAFRCDTRGVTAIEYCLMGALITLVIVSAVAAVGPPLRAIFSSYLTAFE
jgi:pilus assembly protein Flp/PilA